MKKKILAAALGLAMSLQSGGFCTNAVGNDVKDPVNNPVQFVIDLAADECVEINLLEGETVQLVMNDIPDMPEVYYVDVFSHSKKAAMTSDMRLTGISAGEDVVDIYVSYRGLSFSSHARIKVNVAENSDISEDVRAEVNRLGQLDGFYRRQLELLGAIDEDAPRLDMEKVQEILDTSEDYFDIFKQFNEYHKLADVKPMGGGMTTYTYWFDPKGNESVTWYLEQDMVTYTKTADDGTLIGTQFLYPEKGEFYEINNGINYEYMMFNQIPQTGNASLKLNFIDSETGKPFAENEGRFELCIRGVSAAVKSWDASEGSSVTIGELPIENAYELRYIDEYHEDENGELYKYEVVENKGTHLYSFASAREYSFNVYLRRHYINEPVLIGDANGDRVFNIADLVTFQNWLLCKSDAVLANRDALDLCKDGKLDVFDFCCMKAELLKNA